MSRGPNRGSEGPAEQGGRNDPLFWGGLALVGLVAGLSLPKILPKARMAARQIGGITYTDGAAASGVRPKVDPARGIAA